MIGLMKCCKSCGAEAKGDPEMVRFAMKSHKKNYPSHKIARAKWVNIK
jgi:hypothetical protein